MDTKNIDWNKPLECSAGVVSVAKAYSDVVDVFTGDGSSPLTGTVFYSVNYITGIPTHEYMTAHFTVRNKPSVRDAAIASLLKYHKTALRVEVAPIIDHLISNGFINED